MSTPETPAGPARGHEPWWLALVVAATILAAGSWAYGNNDLASPHFDDTHAIVENRSIRVLHQRIEAVSRPSDGLGRRFTAYTKALGPTARALYQANPLRLVTNWSFALTYHDHPFDEGDILEKLRGWHAANDRIHLLNGLLVFCLGWLTLTSPLLRRGGAPIAWPILLSGAAALVFVTHPLQVQAVTYLVQRTESLCATFYLGALCFHGAARRLEHGPRRGKAPWKTGLALGGAGLLLTLGAVVTRAEVMGLTGLLWLAGLLAVAAIAALVVLVRRGDDEPRHAVCVLGSLACFGLAALTKEIGATIPAVLVAWDLLFVPATPGAAAAPGPGGRRPWLLRAVRSGLRTRALELAPWVAIVACVVVLIPVFARFALSGQLLAEGVAEGGAGVHGEKLGAGGYLLTQQNVLCTYVRLFLLPYGQHLDWQYPVAGSLGAGATWLALVSGALVLGALGLAVARGGRARVAAFAVLLTLTVLAPTSTIIVLPDVIFEHRLYLPLAGLALLLFVVADRLAERLLPPDGRPWAVAGAALALTVGLGLLARARNEVFATEITLWRDSAESAGKPRAWTNLGLALSNLEPAVVVHAGGRALGRPERLPDGTYVVHCTTDPTRGVIAVLPPGSVQSIVTTEGGPEAALACYDRALERDPRYPKALNNKAISHISLWRVANEQAKKLRELQGAAQQRGLPALVESCEVQRITYQREARRQAELAEQTMSRIENPDPEQLNNRAANLAMGLGDTAKSIELLRQCVAMHGAPPTSLVTLGHLLLYQGLDRYDEAVAKGDPRPLDAATGVWGESGRLLNKYIESGHQAFARQAQGLRDQIDGYLYKGKPIPPKGSPERDLTTPRQ